jgi:hypothetical protein
MTRKAWSKDFWKYGVSPKEGFAKNVTKQSTKVRFMINALTAG